MTPYPADRERRQAERDRILADELAQARVRASQLGRSMRCSGYRFVGVSRHAGTDEGCRNDGSNCLCECHDRAEGNPT